MARAGRIDYGLSYGRFIQSPEADEPRLDVCGEKAAEFERFDAEQSLSLDGGKCPFIGCAMHVGGP
jgi:hypothetical protein